MSFAGTCRCVVAAALWPVAYAEAQTACGLEWTLEETLRIGSLDGDDALSWIPDIEIDPSSGDIYVPQVDRGEVLVFSESGELLRQFGREGSGPGEFEAGPRFVSWANGELWVADRFRAQSFDADGRPHEFVTFSLPVRQEGSFFRPAAPLADGSFWGHRTVTSRRDGGTPSELNIPLFDRKGIPLDTIATLDVRDTRIVTSSTGGFADHPLWRDLPSNWGLADIVTKDRDGIVLIDDPPRSGSGQAFAIMRISLEGDTALYREVEFEPVRITRPERAWWFHEFAAVMAGDYTQGRRRWLQMDDATRARKRREAADLLWLPDEYPPVRRILAGNDRTIWLLREFSVLDGLNHWEVYDSAGALIGRLELAGGRDHITPWSPRMRILRASADEVWATSTDDLEVPYLHKYQVVRCPLS